MHSSSSDLNIEQWLKQIVYYIKNIKTNTHRILQREINFNFKLSYIFKRRKYLENYSTKLDKIQIRYVHNLL